MTRSPFGAVVRAILVVVTLMAGAAVGSLTARSVEAAVTFYDVYNQPGGVNSSMNCGWHTACIPAGQVGPGLDWGNGDNSPPIWRAVSFGMNLRRLAEGCSPPVTSTDT